MILFVQNLEVLQLDQMINTFPYWESMQSINAFILASGIYRTIVTQITFGPSCCEMSEIEYAGIVIFNVFVVQQCIAFLSVFV